MVSIHAAVAETYREVLGTPITPSLQYALEPIALPVAPFKEQGEVISRFFDGVLRVAKDHLHEDGSPAQRLLFSDLPSHVGLDYHRRLPDQLWTKPLFYRTDQSLAGRIYEIQAPGSGWGDFELLSRSFSAIGVHLNDASTFNARFVDQVREISGTATPSILHLVDNASVPWGIRFFIETTRPDLQYWGYDADVDVLDVDLVRSHSFYGLAAENLYRLRLERARDGRTRFDLPAHVLFDQKAPTVLPFDSATRGYFDDAVRDLFPFTSVVRVDGFQDHDGTTVTWDEFKARPPRDRMYFLKYGGPDVSRNWGSRAVYRMDSKNNFAQLDSALADVRGGEVWLLQVADAERQDVTFWDHEIEEARSELRTAKMSAFHGPLGLLGGKVMLRDHPKVHGQSDTALALVEFEGMES